jgi:hypothetical protein
VSYPAAPADAQPWSPPLAQPVNAKAIIALCTAFCFPILAVVFGVKARREIDRTGEAGRAYANWGLGLGIAWCALIALYLVVVLVVVIGGFAAAASTVSGVAGASGY